MSLLQGHCWTAAPDSFSPLLLLILCPQASPGLSPVSHRLSGLFLDKHFFWFYSGHFAPWGFWIQSLWFSSLFCFRTELQNCDFKMLSLHSLFVSIAWAVCTGETLKPSPQTLGFLLSMKLRHYRRMLAGKQPDPCWGQRSSTKYISASFPQCQVCKLHKGKWFPGEVWGLRCKTNDNATKQSIKKEKKGKIRVSKPPLSPIPFCLAVTAVPQIISFHTDAFVWLGGLCMCLSVMRGYFFAVI